MRSPGLVAAAVVVLAALALARLGRRAPGRCRATRGSRCCSSRSTRCAPTRSAPTATRARARRGSTAWRARACASTAAHAHNVVTLPSHVNILTGLLPLEHGVRDNNGFRVPKDTKTLAGAAEAARLPHGRLRERLRARRALRPRERLRPLGRPRGGRGMEPRLPDPRAARPRDRGRGAALARERRRAELRVRAPLRAALALRAARGLRGRRRPTPTTARSRRPTPRSSRCCGRSWSRATSGRTLVVLTSDHGESLGEHGEATHGVFAYEATLRVPLVIYAPSLFRPRVVSEPVRHVDIVPTVLDVLGIEPPPASRAAACCRCSRARARASRRPSYFEALTASHQPAAGRRSRACATARSSTSTCRCRSSTTSGRIPREARNLAASRPQDLERLRGQLRRSARGTAASRPARESPETLERLRALGYVAAAEPPPPKQRFTADDDPKRLIELDAKTNHMLALYREGKLDEAIAVGREVVARRPDMDLAHMQIAYLERARGDMKAAIAAAQRAVALRPGDPESSALLGGVPDRGRPRARRRAQFLEPWLEARGRRPRRAERARDGARERRPAARGARRARPRPARAPDQHAGAGQRRHRLPRRRRPRPRAPGLRGRARPRPRRGARPQQPRRDRRPRGPDAGGDRALEARGRRSTPGDYQTLFNLGTELWRSGRREEARPYLEGYLRDAPPALEAAGHRAGAEARCE